MGPLSFHAVLRTARMLGRSYINDIPAMFVIVLTYEAPLVEIDRLMPEHMRFVEKCYDAGVFIASGRQVPRTGGVILAVGSKRKDVEDVIALDPFVTNGLASHEIIEFRTSQHHPLMKPFADPGTRAMDTAAS